MITYEAQSRDETTGIRSSWRGTEVVKRDGC